MLFQKLSMPGVVLIEPDISTDHRGSFVKCFRDDYYSQHGICFRLAEEFITISKRGTIRGMHFQLPPSAHSKMVTCVAGKILDVLLDLRTGDGYGRVVTIELADGCTVFVPEGVAHGFLSIDDNSSVIYKTDKEYNPDHDSGILWNSIGFNWPKIDGSPHVISDRDMSHQSLVEFVSPW